MRENWKELGRKTSSTWNHSGVNLKNPKDRMGRLIISCVGLWECLWVTSVAGMWSLRNVQCLFKAHKVASRAVFTLGDLRLSVWLLGGKDRYLNGMDQHLSLILITNRETKIASKPILTSNLRRIVTYFLSTPMCASLCFDKVTRSPIQSNEDPKLQLF